MVHEGSALRKAPGLLSVLFSIESAEASMIGDYPTRGWKFRAFIALIVTIGLIGVVLMFAVGGVMKE